MKWQVAKKRVEVPINGTLDTSGDGQRDRWAADRHRTMDRYRTALDDSHLSHEASRFYSPSLDGGTAFLGIVASEFHGVGFTLSLSDTETHSYVDTSHTSFFNMHFGLGQDTITQRGQLQLTPYQEMVGIIHPEKPVVWGVTEDGLKAMLSQHRHVVEERSESLCGIAILEVDLVVAVPVPVFESVDGIEPRAEVGFAATEEMLEQGAMYLMELDRVFEEFPEINRSTPGKQS